MTIRSAGLTTGVPSGSGWPTRVAAAAYAIFACAYPVRALLLDPQTFWIVKISWWALALASAAWPSASPALLVVVVPLLPVWPRLFDGVPHGVVHVTALAVFLPWLARVAAGRTRVARDAAGAGWLVFVVIAALSLASYLYGYHLVFPSLSAFGAELHGLMSRYVRWRPGPDLENLFVAFTALVDGCVAYLLVRSAGERAPAVAGAFALGVTLTASAGVVQAFTGFAFMGNFRLVTSEIVRLNATWHDPNAVGAFLALGLPLLVAYAVVTHRNVKGWWIAAVCATVATLVMTAGRMAWGGAVVGLLVLGWLGVRWHLVAPPGPQLARAARVLRRSVVGLLLIVAALVAVGTWRDVRHTGQHTYLDTALYTANLRQPLDDIFKGRLLLWQATLLIIRDEPVFGLGIGRMIRQFGSYSQRITDRPAPGATAHNTFLNITAELGIVGLATWLVLLAMVGGAAFSRPAGGEPLSRAWIRAGLAAGFCAYLTTMLTGDRAILREDLILLGAFTAIVTGLAPERRRMDVLARRAAVGAVVLLAAVVPLHARSEAAGVQLDRVRWGLGPEETDGEGWSFRWSTAHAIFHVPAGASHIVLPLRSRAPFPQAVTLSIDGQLADRIVLTDTGWRELRYVLPRHGAALGYLRIDLEVSPTWRPRGRDEDVGVMVGRPGLGR